MERIWIYPIGRPLKADEERGVKEELDRFMGKWNAHGQALKASYEMPYDRFIILKVDEEQAEASGCSIDSSVRLLKEIEKKYNVPLFDRQQMLYLQGDAVKSCTLQEIAGLYREGQLTDNTPVFNTMISREHEMNTWQQPFAESGYARFR